MNSRLLRAAVFAFPLVMFACAGGGSDDTQSGGQDIKHAVGVAEGGTCGGLGALPCQAGLICQTSGAAHPDQSGVCSKPPPVQCQAIPACDPGTESVPSCDSADKSCTSKSMCGHTILCAKPAVHCQAIPACAEGKVEVAECSASDSSCAPLTMCGQTIFCTDAPK